MSAKPGRAGFTRQQIVADGTHPTGPPEEERLWLHENELEQGVMSFTPNLLEKRAAVYAARNGNQANCVRRAGQESDERRPYAGPSPADSFIHKGEDDV